MRVFLGRFCLWLALLSAPAMAADYLLKPGDVLRVEVAEDPSLNRAALVLPDGSISIPMVGSLSAAGRTLAEVRSAISASLEPNFNIPPSVFVGVATLAKETPKAVTPRVEPANGPTGMSIFAMGELGKPGKLQVATGTSLMQFVAQAGGVTPYAATKRVQIRRTDRATAQQKVYQVNLKRLMRGAASKSFVLQEGDVVIVPERKLFE